MAVQEKWRLDRKLTAMMIDDMLFDPILAHKVLLGIEVPPHQELRIMMMWTHSFTVDDSGFSTGKSFTSASISALRSMLMRDRVSGILSKTFAQGKLIFDYYDRWANNNPIFRNSIRMRRGQIQLIHGSDAHVAHFRGGSQIRVLPPDFMKDSERLRSERWHDGYFDEWVTFGNMVAFNKTVMGRVTNVNDYTDCPVRQNHIHLHSTPNFTHHPAYGLVKRIQKHIKRGSSDYARFTSNYRHIPDTPRFRRLVNRKTIFHMQTTLPKGMVAAEVDGLWQKDSGTFYDLAAMTNARAPVPVMLTKRAKENDRYVAAVDIAPGGVDQKSGKSDDFSLSAIRVPPVDIAHQCTTVRYNGITDKQMSGIIHKYHRNFGFSLIGYDPGGGGLFIRDRLRESEQIIDGKVEKCTPIIEANDNSGMVGQRILVPIKRGDKYIDRMWGKMQSDSVLVNRIHREFQGAVDNGNLILAPQWEGWTGNESNWDADAKRNWLNERPTLTEQDRIMAEMDLSVSQLMLVDTFRDDNGQPILDKHGMYKFGSKSKKDSAYSLIYANTMRLLLMNMLELGLIDEQEDEEEGGYIATGAI